jgi:hypothetical protein
VRATRSARIDDRRRVERSRFARIACSPEPNCTPRPQIFPGPQRSWAVWKDDQVVIVTAQECTNPGEQDEVCVALEGAPQTLAPEALARLR